MSTMEHKHGSEDNRTEVPRKTLVSELDRNSKLFSTNKLADEELFHDTVLTLADDGGQAGRRQPHRRARRSRH